MSLTPCLLLLLCFIRFLRCFSDKRPVYLFILHFPPLALTLPIITRFWKQPHAALFSILALHSLWRPYPEVLPG